ncbi:hypothetical protein HBDW_14450 [Herbaspirillum sp. DW155]|uniref:hypothetical protein n=1 Tax=Herbaspirillum sp. DW155 TaxID=3095609 RepID=UPI003085C3B3|nr:hypothetical protein HBDW_14450 [Herbaspirillum sp. DW155]
MINHFVKNIADRYVAIVTELAGKAGANLIVGDLIRSATRNCLVAMHAAGAESGEIRQCLGALMARHINAAHAQGGRTLAAWVHARNHMEFLLFIEEQEELAQCADLEAGAGAMLH